jgi:hypothetical protein
MREERNVPMSPQDAEVIRDVFAKVRAMGSAIDDVEAARLVEQELRTNPAAGLNLIRVVVGLEQERDQFAAHIDELNAYIDQIEAQLNGYAPGHGQGSTSGSLFGGAPQGSPWGGASAPGRYDPPPAQPSPWGGAQPSPAPWGSQQPPQPQGQSQGNGFWGSALKTGAGVAGGLLAFQAVKGLFGGGNDEHARSSERHAVFGGGSDKPQDSGHRPEPGETAGGFGGGGGGDERPRSGGFGGNDNDGGPAPGSIVADNIDFFGGDDRET